MTLNLAKWIKRKSEECFCRVCSDGRDAALRRAELLEELANIRASMLPGYTGPDRHFTVQDAMDRETEILAELAKEV